MSQTIEQIILDQAEKETKKLIADANQNKKNQLEQVESQLKLKNEKILNDLENEYDLALGLLNATHERDLKLELEKAKHEHILGLFQNVLNQLKALKGKDLLEFVATQIKKETVSGDEIIKVSKQDYTLYKAALSTGSGDLVEADLLNKILKTNFKLSNQPLDIESGFVLEGPVFDLNFSFESMVADLEKRYEKEIYERLG
ncbi:hypothetical protein JV173_00755 [Acholeplasma equirhinis]|uniref:V-type ATP synthase subunit E n=1 Tax=Acholeplasma equirhinis TaxID=555393 RepID=UPI00197A8425|nr:hypothetical protein [Acholeplasma equirhinis]MBN3490034.1 hypothetical protein [Acholeplasma equirhinis]